MNQLLPEDNVMMLLTSTYRIRQKEEEEETEFENRYDWEMLFYFRSNLLNDIKLM